MIKKLLVSCFVAIASFGLGLGIAFLQFRHPQIALVPRVHADALPASRLAPAPVSSTPVAPPLLSVPSIGVKAHVQSINLDKAGALGVPTNWTDVGLFKEGMQPGQLGNAVIDGHLDGPQGQHGVFWNLKNVKVGDTIIFNDVNNKQQTFVITAKQYISANDQTLDTVFGPSNEIHLNLITCGGPWDKSTHQFTQRLVVFTTKIN